MKVCDTCLNVGTIIHHESWQDPSEPGGYARIPVTVPCPDCNPRDLLIAGLRQLADFLDDHPDLPVNFRADVVHSVTAADIDPGTDTDGIEAAKRAEVDRVAAILGVTPTVEANGDQYMACISFGPVTYRAAAITDAHMALFRAASTYDGCVTP
jgi:hypothetical protein